MHGNDVNVDWIHTDTNNVIYKKGVILSTFSISNTHERNLSVRIRTLEVSDFRFKIWDRFLHCSMVCIYCNSYH